MFKQTTSLWHRLTNRRPGKAGETIEEERRVWVRHPCDLQTQYAPDADEPPLAGRIIDISRGGVKLIVAQSHQPGSLISVELPGPDGNTTFAALACVVYEGELGGGEWVLGCSFSKELERDQLRVFGISKEAALSEKRSSPRFPVNVTATVQLTNSNDMTRWPAKVLNLSTGGVALLVEQDIRNGTLLTADLSSANGHSVETILVCVVHLTLNEDGSRRLGCNFIRELDEKDLQILLT
jgi:c-di-GMP-binding flagellar brake protein YcgR